jgi:hypothetical protein
MRQLNVLLTFLFIHATFFVQGQTMTFDNGALENGFTLSGWNAASGTIWMENLIEPATIMKDAGTWDFISFTIGPFIGGGINEMRIESNLGDVYDYGDNIVQSHTLNWMGITAVTFSRISGSGVASDHDDIVYTSSLSVGLSDKETTNGLNLYPNPSNGEITIDLGNVYSVAIIRIVDMYGKVVQVIDATNTTSVTLDIEASAGLYSIEVFKGEDPTPSLLRMIKL